MVALARAPDARLVTLTGPGGTGKTRLALEAARELERAFAGGVHFVDLAPLHDPGLVGSTAARALGVRDAEGEALFERVAAALGERKRSSSSTTSSTCSTRRRSSPSCSPGVAPLRVLATSREPLRVRAEHEYRVPALALPARRHDGDLERLAGNEAVALFVARARGATTRLRADARQRRHRRRDLPRARRASARARARRGAAEAPLPVGAARPPRRPARRPDGGDRDLPDRQRTLRAAIDWSYELLAPPERTLLARLSVFAGGWTLEAAEAVCDADLAALGSLVEKSLVQATDSPTGEPRFSMLETVRQYAFERLLAAGEAERDAPPSRRVFRRPGRAAGARPPHRAGARRGRAGARQRPGGARGVRGERRRPRLPSASARSPASGTSAATSARAGDGSIGPWRRSRADGAPSDRALLVGHARVVER